MLIHCELSGREIGVKNWHGLTLFIRNCFAIFHILENKVEFLPLFSKRLSQIDH